CTGSLTINALPASSTGAVVTAPWGGQVLQCYWTLEFVNSAPSQVQFTGYTWSELNDVNGKWTGDCGADCAPAYRMGASSSFQNSGWYAQGGIPTDANGNYLAPVPFTIQWTLDYVLVGDVTGTVRKASTPLLTCNPP
ncbi:MAG TPA: hypothetical protein VFM53_08385, partial [Anaeromyxobacteraceae bacterium]|nr:hypothetical protein [Anaeromyxobacteraceae bacterium]